MGLKMVPPSVKKIPPINEQMKAAKIVESSQFMLWLGMNGGKITIGGYNEDLLYLNSTIKWIPTMNDESYSIELNNLYVGNVHIPHVPRIGFIDSGASWVYMSYEEERHIFEAFDQFCQEGKDKCIGKKVKGTWYQYDTTMNKSLRDFFRSYPTITFMTTEGPSLNWFPSEYFSQQGNTSVYCISIEGSHIKNKIILGGSFLRQQLIVFDPEHEPQVGFARGQCSDDPNRVITEVVHVSEGFYAVECHQWDLIEEETNIILLCAVALLAVFIFAIAAIAMGYCCNQLNKKNISYAQFNTEEDKNNSQNAIEMEDIGFLRRWDDEGDHSNPIIKSDEV